MRKLNLKIIIPVIIAIVIIAVLGGIIIKQQKDINVMKERTGISDTKTETKETKTLTQEELSKYIKEIPITTDNWKDYVTIENKKVENKDQFGDVISYTNQYYTKIKENNIYGYLLLKVNWNDRVNENDSASIEVMSGRDTDIFIPFISTENVKTYTINDFQCIKLKGNLYTIDLPDDIWENNNQISVETSEKYRENVQGNNEYIYITKDNYIEEFGEMVEYENSSDMNVFKVD